MATNKRMVVDTTYEDPRTGKTFRERRFQYDPYEEDTRAQNLAVVKAPSPTPAAENQLVVRRSRDDDYDYDRGRDYNGYDYPDYDHDHDQNYTSARARDPYAPQDDREVAHYHRRRVREHYPEDAFDRRRNERSYPAPLRPYRGEDDDHRYGPPVRYSREASRSRSRSTSRDRRRRRRARREAEDDERRRNRRRQRGERDEKSPDEELSWRQRHFDPSTDGLLAAATGAAIGAITARHATSSNGKGKAWKTAGGAVVGAVAFNAAENKWQKYTNERGDDAWEAAGPLEAMGEGVNNLNLGV